MYLELQQLCLDQENLVQRSIRPGKWILYLSFQILLRPT
ncbi:hypothetical protein ACMD2_12494 [Ananas comosus]|uniref:Uncharacterized protein n=1 Tax=Ananas comosus TaxID=4615 RepID=A0A199VGL2_ANACO|nr:hypothetical protein ACMD2_12494 [Ananas comosus]